MPADVNPQPKNDTAEAAAPAAPAPPAKAPAGEALPTIEDLPQYKFAREVEHSPIANGNAESRYLTIVYGMIKSHLRETPELHLDTANKHGVVDFYVDEGGNLVGRKLVSSSGSPNLDMAVMAAIAAAAPYPAPPSWSPIYLTYNFAAGAKRRPSGQPDARWRRSRDAIVINPDAVKIPDAVPNMHRLHAVFSAFLTRQGVELVSWGERGAGRRIGIIDESDVAIAPAAAQGCEHPDQEDNSHSRPPSRIGGPSRSSPTLCRTLPARRPSRKPFKLKPLNPSRPALRDPRACDRLARASLRVEPAISNVGVVRRFTSQRAACDVDRKASARALRPVRQKPHGPQFEIGPLRK